MRANLPLIGIGISIVGFFYTVLVTYSFIQISERIPHVFYQYSHINRAGRLQSGSGVFAVCAEMDGKIQ